jgi:hypothetical protein
MQTELFRQHRPTGNDPFVHQMQGTGFFQNMALVPDSLATFYHARNDVKIMSTQLEVVRFLKYIATNIP